MGKVNFREFAQKYFSEVKFGLITILGTSSKRFLRIILRVMMWWMYRRLIGILGCIRRVCRKNRSMIVLCRLVEDLTRAWIAFDEGEDENETVVPDTNISKWSTA